MRGIIQFLQQYSYLLIFVVLQTISLIFVFSKTNPYQHSKYINSSNVIAGTIYQNIDKVSSYFNLEKEIEQLREQNQQLLQQLQGNKMLVGNYFSLIEDTLYAQQYLFQKTTAIQIPKDNVYNYITISSGSSNGIRKDMGIIGTKGIVGYVVATSPHFSTVLPVVHPKFVLSVKHKKTNSFALLKWKENNTLKTATVEDISSFINLQKGDTIVTTGGDGLFPEGSFVGTVKEYSEIPGKGELEITVSLVEDFSSLHSVYAIDNIIQLELTTLIDSVKNNE